MAKACSNNLIDNGPQYLKDNCTKVVLLIGNPGVGTGTPYTDANTNYGTSTGKKLAEVTVDSTDFTVADGDTSGRKVTLAAQNGVSVLVPADPTTAAADHIGFLDVTGTEVLAVTSLSASKSVSDADQVNIPTVDLEVGDPT